MINVMNALIELHGETYDVHSATEGAAGDYGYHAQTWSKVASEKIWVQRVQGLQRGTRLLDTLAGRIDDSDFIAYLKSDSVVSRGDVLQRDGVRYDVRIVIAEKVITTVSHYEAHLKLLEEGD